MIFKVIAPQPYGVVLPIVLGYERINDMDEVNRIDPSLYYLATQKHKKEFEQQAERIKELEGLRGGVRVTLIAAKNAVIKGGEVTEEMLTELIDELEVKP